MKQLIAILFTVVSGGVLPLCAQDMAGLLDAAATAKGKEYLVARDRILALGEAAVPQLEAVKAQADIPWQRRVMARICLDRIQRGEDILTFVNYNWRNDPRFKDHPGWESRLGFPPDLLEAVKQRLSEANLPGYCFELAWKQPPPRNRHREQTALGILIGLKDPDLVYWAREELQKVDPMYIDVNWAFAALLRLKDHDSLRKMFDLWFQQRPESYRIHYEGTLERHKEYKRLGVVSEGITRAEAHQLAIGIATEPLVSLLALARPDDVGWIKGKLQRVELGDAAQNALNAYLVRASGIALTTLGTNPVTIACGGTYADAGATATDNKGADITARIVVENNVNAQKVGAYQVVYRIADAAGNTFTATRTVKVVYKFDGFLPPIGGADATGGSFDQPVRAFKLGSTIPVKFKISCGGAAVKDGVHTLQAIRYNNDKTPTGPIEPPVPGDWCKLTGDEWHFNLDTKATGMGRGIWVLVATLGDGSMHLAWIALQ